MKQTFIFISVLVMLVCGGAAKAQTISPQDMEKFRIMEDSMVLTADSMYEAFLPDTHIAYSERLVRQLVRTLKIPNSYYYPFDTLKKLINIIYSDDNAFKMFNWEITPSQITKRYYGAIQLPGPTLKLFGLLDYSEQLGKGAEDSILTNRKWYGAIVYRIMSQEVRGIKVYTMFGFNQASAISNKKVLDPMILEANGVSFGAPIFDVASNVFPNRRINRFILEYKKHTQASMNWDAERKMIVFDKLVSQVNDPNRKYTFVASGQYDGFIWGGESWMYQRDIMPITILKDGESPLGMENK